MKKDKQKRLEELYTLLIQSDYKTLKHIEGQISDDEFEAIKAQRQAWRDEINELENN